MKKFSNRLKASWHTPKVLRQLLDQFFEDNMPKTLPHLYFWLNTNAAEISEKVMHNDKMYKLITAAETYIEARALKAGFEEDKSFAKWYLQTYHPVKPKEETTDDSSPVIRFELIKS